MCPDCVLVGPHWTNRIPQTQTPAVRSQCSSQSLVCLRLVSLFISQTLSRCVAADLHFTDHWTVSVSFTTSQLCALSPPSAQRPFLTPSLRALVPQSL